MTKDKLLYIPHLRIVDQLPLPIVRVTYSRHESALLVRAMADAYSPDSSARGQAGSYTTYYAVENGQRILQYREASADELQTLVQNFRRNPKEAIAVSRCNLIHLVQDQTVPEVERKGRLNRYLKAHLDLIEHLDHAAFPPDNGARVYEGIPSYIPDGLSDMGSNPDPNPYNRDREKIRVDKHTSHQKAFGDLSAALWSFSNTGLDPSSDDAKKYLVSHVMATVYQKMEYDHQNMGNTPIPNVTSPFGQSIPIDSKVSSAQPSAVCRHIAMETQIRLQAFGLEARLLKCDMDGVPHVANLIRIGGQWQLIDSTNPEWDPANPDLGRPYARRIDVSDSPRQTWKLNRYIKKNGIIDNFPVIYSARNNMYYRVLNNKTHPPYRL